MRAVREYARMPSISTGYELDDQFSVVVPVARTNLVSNPSFETNTTSWTAIGGSIARSTLFQYHGTYSLAVTPAAGTTDGVRFDTVSLAPGLHAYSAKVLGVAGVAYTLGIETTAGVAITSAAFTAMGRWQWIVGYYSETATTTRRVTLRKAGSTGTGVIYLDGVQVEALVAGETVSTYLDGDQIGLVPNQNPVAYFWNGTPHASTSVRSALTRAGGMVIPFRQFGFYLTAIIGLGLALPQNTGFEYARIDGGYDDFTRKPSRQFTLSGQMQGGMDYLQLRQNRGGLARLLDRDLVAQDQQLLLLRDVIDPCGVVQAQTCRIVAKYQSGFEGNTDNQTAEQLALTFKQYLPMVVADGEAGTALAVQTSVLSVNRIIQRSPAGVWSTMATGADATVLTISVGLDGTVYAGGTFTLMDGVANTLHIAKWSPLTQAWTAMSTGAIGAGAWVQDITVAPDGQIIAAGANGVTSFGGVANTANLARWTGSAWQSITPAGSPNGSVNAVLFDGLGNLYAAGNFTTINAVAAARIAKMTPAGVWSALGAGLNVAAFILAIDKANNVYVGGSFTTPFQRVTMWNGAAFVQLGGAMDNDVYGLAIAPNGGLFAAGLFRNAGTVALAGIGLWNGTQWKPMSSGLGGVGGNGQRLKVDPVSGLLYVGGTFTTAGGITTPDAFAIWNGSAFVYPPIDLPGTQTIYGIAFGPDGSLYLGFNLAGTATTAGTTTITNPGTARSYPTIKINGPTATAARIFSILNTTTNRNIYLNLTMNVGDVATLVLKPDALSFTSAFLGNVANTIALGSNAADFFLQSGANVIQFFSADSTVVATLSYRPAYLSLDDVP